MCAIGAIVIRMHDCYRSAEKKKFRTTSGMNQEILGTVIINSVSEEMCAR